ncbi:WD40 repeat domain-containing protein [Sphaerisporangium perillae]|uniref:WD40 repeat domain-containing protein n=1 Tax=Sphaerisporangium perillae TaxID=2935860 RepID=UPI00200EF7F5|nr:WD40 repeat domain-containing protein [Sphaerisporangium perillae]
MSPPGTVSLSVEHDGSVTAIAFSPDSTRFASGGEDSVVRVRTIGTGPPLDLPSSGFVSSIAFSPDGARLAVADLDQVFMRGAADGAVIWQGAVAAGNSVNFIAFGAEGKSLVTATDTVVAVLDVASGVPRRHIAVDRQIAGIDLSRDGTRVAVAIDERHGGNHRFAGSARVLDLATGSELGRLTPDNAVFAVAFSPDGSTVLCCSADDTTRMFEAVGGMQLWPDKEEAAEEVVTAPNCLAFDPAGRWAVVGGSDGFARILEAESGVESIRVPKLDPGAPDPGLGAVTHVAFSPNGKWAASVCIDDLLRVFNIKSGVYRYEPRGTGEVLALRFSPDGRWLGLGYRGGALVIDNGEPGGG